MVGATGPFHFAGSYPNSPQGRYTMKKSTLIALGICSVFALVVVGITVAVMPGLVSDGNRARMANNPAANAPTGGVQIGKAAIGGPFTLINQDGETVTQATFDGQYRLMFFGFTHCPDFCPTKLYHISQMLDRLPAEQVAKIAPIFVTIDPARDTAPILKDYLTGFDPRFTGLTGSAEQVAAAAKAFRVYFQKVPGDDPEFYNVDHSTFTYVMGPDNSFIDVITYDTPIEVMVEKVGSYVSGSAG
jgi:cytochrome oxidase Cu insertion factor (SCO1/SenC/PrrC family)